MTLLALGAVSPWLSMLDRDKYGRFVDTVQQIDITTIAACHTPVIEGPFIRQAFDLVRAFPSIEPPPLPDQSILDQIVAATAHALGQRAERERRGLQLRPPCGCSVVVGPHCCGVV